MIVARAVALRSTLNDIESVRNLLGISKNKRAFHFQPNASVYEKHLGRAPMEIKVLDPFAGAGNLIFEAKRLGLNCSALDYNPVAHLLLKSILEYPPKYHTNLADDVEKYGKELIERTRKEIGDFFVVDGKKSLAYIWVWCIMCPYCKQRLPLTNHMWFAKTQNKKVGFRLRTTEDLNFRVELEKNITEKEGNFFTQKGGKAICIRCRNSIDYQNITNDIAKRHDREMIAIIFQDVKGKNYKLSSEQDRRTYVQSQSYLKQKWNTYEDEGLIPNEDIRARSANENPLWHYGIKKYYEFFGDRQLLVMLTLLKNVRQICKEIQSL